MVKFVKINLSALLLAVALAATAGAAPLKDNGTGPDGIFIIPSKFAMRCDISSHDVHDDGKIEKCLNRILRMKLGSQTFSEGYDRFFTEAFHELNRDYIDVAIQRKAMAGDVADQMEKAMKEDAYSDGAFSSAGGDDDEENLRIKQTQNGKLATMGASNVVDIIDVYSSQLALNAMAYYHQYEFSENAAAIPEEDEGTQ